MKTKLFLSIAAYVLLFVGLLWLFLPHAFHNSIEHVVSGEGEDHDEIVVQGISDHDAPHYVHLIEGMILVLAGLGCAILSNRIK